VVLGKNMEITKFKHIYKIRVRNYEIDWQGIVHNGNYLLYFEIARVDYFKAIGISIDERLITGAIKIVVVRNEIDYYNPATFDEELVVHTRTTKIGTSSFVCEGVILHAQTNILIARNVNTMVWLDPRTNKSTPVPEDFRQHVRKFEGGDCDIQSITLDV
jgi:acyl-CoA thioester hydrolase